MSGETARIYIDGVCVREAVAGAATALAICGVEALNAQAGVGSVFTVRAPSAGRTDCYR